MTDIQRKGIEILNGIMDGSRKFSEDDYFFLMSFIIDRPQEIAVPTPYPVIQPWVPPTVQPWYGQRYEITCKAE